MIIYFVCNLFVCFFINRKNTKTLHIWLCTRTRNILVYYNVCIIWLIRFVIKIKCYKNRCKCISFTTIFWMYPSQNAHYFHVYLDKRNYANYPNWLHRSKLVICVYTFGKRSENFAYAEVIPPSKFNNYGWTGYGEFVEYVEIRRRRIGGWMIDRRFY